MAPGSVRMRDADEDSLAVSDEEAEEVMSGSQEEDASGGSYAASGSDSGAPTNSEDATSEEADLGVLEGGEASGSRSLGYRVINSESLKRLQRDAINDVAGIWGCTPAISKTLLMSYMWDKERLLSEGLGRAGRGRGLRGALAGCIRISTPRAELPGGMPHAPPAPLPHLSNHHPLCCPSQTILATRARTPCTAQRGWPGRMAGPARRPPPAASQRRRPAAAAPSPAACACAMRPQASARPTAAAMRFATTAGAATCRCRSARARRATWCACRSSAAWSATRRW